MSGAASAPHAGATALRPQLRPSPLAQALALSRRSSNALARQPSLVMPSVFFPLFFAALGAASFSGAIAVPGFPDVDSYLDFAFAGAVLQGVLFGSTVGATALAIDIETGFFDRLAAAPTARVNIIVGRLAGGMLYGALQTVFFVIVLLPFGLNIEAGIAGVAALVLSGVTLALGVGALMSAMAFRTGSAEAVQGTFPLLFVALFFSSSFFPRETMSGLYGTIADWNPVSHLVEGMRDLVVDGFTASAVVRAVAIPAALSIATIALAIWSLQRRLASS